MKKHQQEDLSFWNWKCLNLSFDEKKLWSKNAAMYPSLENGPVNPAPFNQFSTIYMI